VTFRVSVPARTQVIDAPIMAGYFETVPRRRNPCCGSPGYQSHHGQSLYPQHLISRAKRPEPPTSVTSSCIAPPAATLRSLR
jgi:hypothetical protein